MKDERMAHVKLPRVTILWSGKCLLGGIPGERPRSGGLVSFCSNMARRFLTALIVAVLGNGCPPVVETARGQDVRRKIDFATLFDALCSMGAQEGNDMPNPDAPFRVEAACREKG
jgi:hypothetical protein